MSKFENAEVGNRVWSSKHGWGRITKIDKSKVFNLLVASFLLPDNTPIEITYTFDGRESLFDLHPTLFWNEIKLPAEEEDKKPFDLVEFLKKNLVPKEFKEDDDNIFLNYDYIEKRIDWDCNEIVEIMGTIYFEDVEFEKLNILVNEMNDRGITPDQLKEAYKEIGWL